MTDPNETFSPTQMAQLGVVVRSAVREELADAGLRIDDATHQDEAREDFRWLRKMRRAWDGSAAKVGNAVLMSILAIIGVILSIGFWAWINRGGGP